MKYLLLTKFWNERNDIPDLVKHISEQTLRPSLWLLIDDGSTDKSLSVFMEETKQYNLDVISSRTPQKEEGNLDRVGIAYKKAFSEHWKKIESLKLDYLAMIDVDTRIPPNYFENLILFLNRNRKVGCICGQSSTNKRIWQPMGSGKVCRWEIVKHINLDKSWHLDWDSYLNTYSEALGYKNAVVENMLVNTPPSQRYSRSGALRYGRILFYNGTPFWYAFWKFIRRYVMRGKVEEALFFLRGYITEFVKHDWRCDDPIIREYHSIEGILLGKMAKRYPVHFRLILDD